MKTKKTTSTASAGTSVPRLAQVTNKPLTVSFPSIVATDGVGREAEKRIRETTAFSDIGSSPMYQLQKYILEVGFDRLDRAQREPGLVQSSQECIELAALESRRGENSGAVLVGNSGALRKRKADQVGLGTEPDLVAVVAEPLQQLQHRQDRDAANRARARHPIAYIP